MMWKKSVQNKVEMREKWIVKVSHPSNVTLHKIIEIQLFLSKTHSQMLGLLPTAVAFHAPCMNSPPSHIPQSCSMSK